MEPYVMCFCISGFAGSILHFKTSSTRCCVGLYVVLSLLQLLFSFLWVCVHFTLLKTYICVVGEESPLFCRGIFFFSSRFLGAVRSHCALIFPCRAGRAGFLMSAFNRWGNWGSEKGTKFQFPVSAAIHLFGYMCIQIDIVKNSAWYIVRAQKINGNSWY